MIERGSGAVQYLAAAFETRAQLDRFSLATQALVAGVNRLLALLLLMSFAPLMAWIAWRIWREDGAPVFFAHYRVGRQGRLFRCLKFRTMVRDSKQRLEDLLARDPEARAQWQRDQKLADDPRITPIGGLLRRTSLDELPQLFNVLAGEMALVGPRPITVPELSRYGVVRWHYLNVLPGMTGLWQVSGRNELDYAQRVALDRDYVERRGLWTDAWILWRTVGVVLQGVGAR